MKMAIAEKYVSSLRTSNLKDDARNHNTDILAAVALSDSKFGSMMWRFKFAGDKTTIHNLRQAFIPIVEKRAHVDRWPANIFSERIAYTALMYWAFPNCPSCTGTGRDRKIDELECIVCHGSGKREISEHFTLVKYIKEMVLELGYILAEAELKAQQKVGRSIEV